MKSYPYDHHAIQMHDSWYYQEELVNAQKSLRILRDQLRAAENQKQKDANEIQRLEAQIKILIKEAREKVMLLSRYPSGTKLTPWLHRGDPFYWIEAEYSSRRERLAEIWKDSKTNLWIVKSDFLVFEDSLSESHYDFQTLQSRVTKEFNHQFGWLASNKSWNIATLGEYCPNLEKKKNSSKRSSRTKDSNATVSESKKQKKKRTKKMSSKNTNSESTKEMFVRSVTHGGKVAAADEASEVLLQLVEALAGEAYPELAKTERGKDFMKMFAALGLHYAASNYGEMVPHSEGVADACGLVIEASARDVIQPQLAKLQPVLARLASVGASALTEK